MRHEGQYVHVQYCCHIIYNDAHTLRLSSSGWMESLREKDCAHEDEAASSPS